jgi:hypothetical protein
MPLFIIGETSLIVRYNLLRKEIHAKASRPCWHTRRRWQRHGWLSQPA